MILETLLVSRLGPEVRNVLSCSRILRNVAQKKFRPKGGNDPTFGCSRGRRAGRPRPLATETRIGDGSKSRYTGLIQIEGSIQRRPTKSE